jgi:hypothetical protein
MLINNANITGSLAVVGTTVLSGSLAVSTLSGSGVRYLVSDGAGNMTAQTASAAIKNAQSYTASAGQTTFAVTNGYTTNLVDVYINGSKLLDGLEYNDTSGTNIVLTTGSFAGDIVEIVTYQPASGVTNNSLRTLTSFTATAGQTTFSASYVPGLLDVYYNGSRLNTVDYTAANGNSIILTTGSNTGDILDVLVYSYQVGAFSGIGGTGTANQIAYWNTTNSITGSSNFIFNGSALAITGSFAVFTGSAAEFQVNATGVNLGNALTDSHVISGSLRVNPNGLFVSSSGLVGIGTSSPSTQLHILGLGSEFGDGLRVQRQSGSFQYGIMNMVGGSLNFTSVDQSGLNIPEIYFKRSINGTSSSTSMMIDFNGKVGIGTVTPNYTLHIDSNTTLTRFQITNSTTGQGAGVGLQIIQDGLNTTLLNKSNGYMALETNNNERARFASDGDFLVGTTTNSGFTTAHRIKGPSTTENAEVLSVDGGVEYSGFFKSVSGANYSAAACAMQIGRNTSSLRSINAGGTVNASGADYAEYMFKAVEDTIAKGDIVGINAEGKLTNIYADSISFVVKSTDPSYVGGDTWGNSEAIGKEPRKQEEQTDEEYEQLKAEYQLKLEEARAKVDRIAFSGQVPCNVTGANVGDYIIPIELENGKIGGQAVTNPIFEQYQISVGKVWKIMDDGRAWIAVKIG